MIKAWAGNGRFDFVFRSCSGPRFPPVIDEKLKRLRLHWSLVWFKDQIWFHITRRPQSFQAHLSYFRFHTWGHWVLLVCGFPSIEMQSKIKVHEHDMPDREFSKSFHFTQWGNAAFAFKAVWTDQIFLVAKFNLAAEATVQSLWCYSLLFLEVWKCFDQTDHQCSIWTGTNTVNKLASCSSR